MSAQSTEVVPSLSGRYRNLIDEALLIEQEDTRALADYGFMPSALAQLTLPHSDPCSWIIDPRTNQKLEAKKETLYYERTTGRVSLSIRGHKRYGVPFGSIPRVVLAWMCREAKITKDPVLTLGRNAAEFAKKLDMHYNGRDLGRLKSQALALARAVISIDGPDDASPLFEDIKITSRGFVFWSDRNPEQPTLWESTLTLTDEFFKAAMVRSVPYDWRVYRSLSKSPFAMDLYVWLTYRMFVLQRSRHQAATIPWVALKSQFGGNYADTALGLRQFKSKFKIRLREILLFYPEATNHVEDAGESLRLTPCRLHVERIRPYLAIAA